MFDIDENTFWTFFWMMAFTAIVALVAVLTDYYDSRNEYMTKLISEGADPIAVMCAFDDTKGDNPTCVMIATHQSKQENTVKKSLYQRLVAMLKLKKRGFKRMADNPAGTKMMKRALGIKRRGCDGTLRP